MSSEPVVSAHVIDELGLEHRVDDDASYGRAEISPGMLVPGTDIVRIGVLAILADVVAGQPPSGPITPTTDISIHVARVPVMKAVHLTSRVLKAGATLVVIETLLVADDEPEPFATSLATFMNRPVELGDRSDRSGLRLGMPLHTRIGARVLRPGTVELDPRDDLSNGYHGTIQGGVMAVLGELAVESAVENGGAVVVTDLDIRFLNRVKVGPAQAVARMLINGPEERVFGVTVRDSGNDDRTVAYVSASCSPIRRFC